MKYAHRLEMMEEKQLAAMGMEMSFAENKTGMLWMNFMPMRHQIQNRKDDNLISMQIYNEGFFEPFNPHQTFKKWAAAEINLPAIIPANMELVTIPAGMYAIFEYKGLNTDPSVFQYILQEWLPKSAYVLDHRPHFEILGPKYRNNDPNSEEEICIPIKPK